MLGILKIIRVLWCKIKKKPVYEKLDRLESMDEEKIKIEKHIIIKQS